MTQTSLDELLSIAKHAYKQSIVHDYHRIQDELLSMITTIEILKNNQKTIKHRRVSSRTNIDDFKYNDMGCIAYVLSEFGHQVLYPDKTQSQAIEYIANILDTKPSTLRNIRDFLDSYTNSPREGWKKELSPKLQRIFDECSIVYPQEVVIEKAKQIIKKYEEKK